MNANGLYVTCIEHIDVHGGTIRCFIKSSGGNSKSVMLDIEREQQNKLDWNKFKGDVLTLKNDLVCRLSSYQFSEQKVIGYGAAAKAAVLLNYCNIGTDLLHVVVDCTLDKQGKLMPGTHQLVIPPEKISEYSPDVILVLAWNHFKEIVNNESNKHPKVIWISPHNLTE